MMTGDELSPRRQQILDYLIETISQRGYPPSMREIAAAVGLKSPSTVLFHLRLLEKAGYIERTPSLNRALKTLSLESGSRTSARYVPIVGTVAAGQPLFAAENIDEWAPVPEGMFPGEELFMLRVTGDSMIGAGILDNDLVVVSHQPTAEPGDIVVALLGDEATVKYFHLHEDGAELRPANPAMSSIFTNDLQIIGKVVGVMRTLA